MSEQKRRVYQRDDKTPKIDFDDPAVAAQLEETANDLLDRGVVSTYDAAEKRAKFILQDDHRRADVIAAEEEAKARAREEREAEARAKIDAVDLDAETGDPFFVEGAPDIAPLTPEAFAAEVAQKREAYGPEVLDDLFIPQHAAATDEDRRRWIAGVWHEIDLDAPGSMREHMLDFIQGLDFLQASGHITAKEHRARYVEHVDELRRVSRLNFTLWHGARMSSLLDRRREQALLVDPEAKPPKLSAADKRPTDEDIIKVLELDPELSTISRSVLGGRPMFSTTPTWRYPRNERGMVPGKSLVVSDDDVAQAGVLVRKYLDVAADVVRDKMIATRIVGYSNGYTFSPLWDYMVGLPEWDRRPRIAQMLGDAVEDDEYNRLWCEHFMLGIAWRAINPGGFFQQFMIMFSEQGKLGKSSWIKALPPVHLHVPELVKIPSEDIETRRVAAASPIGLFDECKPLDEGKRAKETMKLYVTSQDDTLRPLYKNDPVSIPRARIDVGTTNRRTLIPAGNENVRRFVVLELTGKIPAYCFDRRWLDALLAEARDRIIAGQRPYYGGRFEELAEAASEVYVDSTIADELDAWLQNPVVQPGSAADVHVIGQLGHRVQMFDDPRDKDVDTRILSARYVAQYVRAFRHLIDSPDDPRHKATLDELQREIDALPGYTQPQKDANNQTPRVRLRDELNMVYEPDGHAKDRRIATKQYRKYAVRDYGVTPA